MMIPNIVKTSFYTRNITNVDPRLRCTNLNLMMEALPITGTFAISSVSMGIRKEAEIIRGEFATKIASHRFKEKDIPRRLLLVIATLITTVCGPNTSPFLFLLTLGASNIALFVGIP